MDNQIDRQYDLTRLMIKPLYFGLVVNILIPSLLLLICYLIERGGGRTPLIDDTSRGLFYVLVGVAIIVSATALWWRHVLVSRPMATSLPTFEEDFRLALLSISRPVFMLIASVALLGILYYFLAGEFEGALLFVVISFVVFQIVRPRPGSVSRLIRKQKAMLEKKPTSGPDL